MSFPHARSYLTNLRTNSIKRTFCWLSTLRASSITLHKLLFLQNSPRKLENKEKKTHMWCLNNSFKETVIISGLQSCCRRGSTVFLYLFLYIYDRNLIHILRVRLATSMASGFHFSFSSLDDSIAPGLRVRSGFPSSDGKKNGINVGNRCYITVTFFYFPCIVKWQNPSTDENKNVFDEKEWPANVP